MSPKQTDLRTRIGELEATVSGLTQELVDATERIRTLEEALDAEPEPPKRRETGREDGDEDAGGSAKQMSDESEAEDETPSDLDGIIVA